MVYGVYEYMSRDRLIFFNLFINPTIDNRYKHIQSMFITCMNNVAYSYDAGIWYIKWRESLLECGSGDATSTAAEI